MLMTADDYADDGDYKLVYVCLGGSFMYDLILSPFWIQLTHYILMNTTCKCMPSKEFTSSPLLSLSLSHYHFSKIA